MSQAVAVAARAGGPATQVVRRAENDLGRWLKEVVDGNGSSPAQMILTVVLGCIPYVGQAVDAYNIIQALIKLSDEPDEGDHWLELVLCLVALVPGFGDALKNVFKQLRNGKQMGRILDSLPNQLRGNVERWFRTLNWAAYTRDLTSIADTMLGKLIALLDGWVTRAVMGNARVKQVVAQLERIKAMARRNIEEVMQSLKRSHQKALQDPLPNTTAAAPAVARSPTRTPPPGSSAPGNVRTTTSGNSTPAQGNGNGSHRQSPPRRSNAKLGSSGEHITDYYFVKRNKTRTKVSNRGVLWEYQQEGHPGIDHVWHNDRLPFKYRVTDTKATGKGRHMKLMTPTAAFEALRMGIDVYFGQEDDKQVRRSVGTTVSDGVQLSHKWVVRKTPDARLMPIHERAMADAMKAWKRSFSKDAAGHWRLTGKAPYDRSLVTVVGPNLDLHDNSKTGGDMPKCTRPVKVHQIAAEFILPTEVLFE